MSQGHRRHGGRSYTLLYYIGLEEKEGGRRRDRTAQVARCTGQGKGDGRTEEQGQGGKRNGRQKDKRTEKKEDRRTKEQEKRKRERKTKEQKDKRTEKMKRERKTEGQKNRKKKKGTETYSYLPFLMPPTSSLFSMVISVFFTEALSLPKR